MAEFDKIVVVTKKTALEELTERFNTRAQAAFYINRMSAQASPAPVTRSKGTTGLSAHDDQFAVYQDSHDVYHAALVALKSAIPGDCKQQFIERSFLPNFSFGPHDLVVTLGPDGLVVNTAKYLHDQPLLALNPDPDRIDGVLLPYGISQAADMISALLGGHVPLKNISMARASLNNGQQLYALNDLFIGPRTHQSARYVLHLDGRTEIQSSSGIIVSTGAGSTGWFRSVLTGSAGVVEAFDDGTGVREVRERYRFDWESEELCFSVREPFVSKTSGADIVFGRIPSGGALELESQMPQGGVIFSDGIESDFLEFNSGAITTITLADRKLRLIAG